MARSPFSPGRSPLSAQLKREARAAESVRELVSDHPLDWTDNQVTGNGAAPPPLPIPLPGVDLLWDGSGIGNCLSGNTFDRSFPPGLPACS